MSYSIIRSISVVKGKVYLNSAANNICPHWYIKEEIPSLTRILQEQGRDALDKEILHQYWGGMFKGGSNDYVRACSLGRIKYPDIKWNNTGDELGLTSYGCIKYTHQEVSELLLECLKEWKARDKTKKYVIALGSCWLTKIMRTRYRFCFQLNRAKLYDELEARIAAGELSDHLPIIMEVTDGTLTPRATENRNQHAGRARDCARPA